MGTLKELEPGQAQVLSYFKPGLLPGEYTINVDQTIIGPGDATEKIGTEKSFIVGSINPYQLPAASISSVYPGDGEVVEARILPRITLSDAHLPWELSPDEGTIGKQFLNGSPVPWLALLVFIADELDTLPTLPPGSSPLSPSSTYTCQLSKRQLQGLKDSSEGLKTQVPISNAELERSPDDLISTIFVKSAAFRGYFSNQVPKGEKQSEPEISRYSYLAHIRRSRSTQAQDSSTNSHGIILGHRAGPLNLTSATTAYAHLVSLMGVKKDHVGWPDQNSSDLTALVSLHSWTYTWEPSGSDIEDVIKELKDNVRPLARQFTDKSSENAWLKRRMDAGYTFVKHRMMSGEATTALYRGPLVPHQLQANWTATAETKSHGSGLQIIDSETGMIDISYSTAWNLGRSLALANSSFTTALSALRIQLTLLLRKDTSSDFVAGEDSATGQLPDWFKTLQGVSKGGKVDDDTSGLGMGSRWKRSQHKLGTTAHVSVESTSNIPAVRNFLANEVLVLVEDKDWYSRDLSEPTQEGLLMAKVLDFVYNQLLTLRAIPHNYLFPEPDILETEAVLTFYIDPLWLDALVDGALSIGNHSTINEDIIRTEIKRAINTYLSQAEEDYKQPRIPRWGVILCGRLLRSFGDLRIRTGSSTSASPQLLTSTKLNDQALFLLFNCRPGGFPEGLTISQPPHQQRFAAGTTLDATKIHIQPCGVRPGDASGTAVKIDGIIQHNDGQTDDSDSVFDFNSRCLRPMGIMARCVKQTTPEGGSYPGTGSSTLLSLILGDKLQELNIKIKDEQADLDREAPLEQFQLRLPPKQNDTAINSWTNSIPESSVQQVGTSSGSISLGLRPVCQVQTSALTRTSHAKDEVKSLSPSATTTYATASKAEKEYVPSSVASSCRVLRRFTTSEGSCAADLVVVLKAGDNGQLDNSKSNLKLQGLNVSFPLGTFLDPASVTRPTVTLIGQGSARWVAGSACVEGDRSDGSDTSTWTSTFVVRLRPRAAKSTKQVDLGFLLTNLTLSPDLEEKVEFLVEEEYGSEGGHLDGESQMRVALQSCEIDGLSES
ncbi:hypothetical protein BKA59DRAFT_481272 [Fusarium tricinctum]|uniref:Uncharacterized protein n=1 Tax=Fusarium tricinctum TaxID=61284 RepID=A0A8K0RVA4_9HYPO|nr:hypothetical protein BKA59DRAFT_481272 [Fusarium tricinctum]